MNDGTNETTAGTSALQGDNGYVMNWSSLPAIVYYLFIASFMTGGIAALIGVILLYTMAGEFTGTLYQEHRRYLLRTFWFSVLWGVIGFITFFIVIGWFLLVGAGIWALYRMIRGLYLLGKGRSPY